MRIPEYGVESGLWTNLEKIRGESTVGVPSYEGADDRVEKSFCWALAGYVKAARKQRGYKLHVSELGV